MTRIRYLILFGLCLMLTLGGQTACKKSEEVVEEEGTATLEEGVIEFEGTVKVAVGKYLFVPKVRGFDIVVQGPLDVGETDSLIDNDIRGKGQFSLKNPSILVADEIEIKEAENVWRKIFTRSEEVALDDYLDLESREEFEVLENITYDKKDGWEGKEKVRVYGRLITETQGEGGGENHSIALLDEGGREKGTILVDNVTDFAQYYVKKLRLFDKFWFYITVKETVDWGTRRRTRELFHADVLLAGLF